MTTPDVPLRMELTVELPGTAEQVWDAIATANGISSWFVRTDLEEREGGKIVTHMGPDAESPGTVTRWDPPHRFRYEEPDWAAFSGHEGGVVTPLVTEFLVEARSGGTCVLRVVSSAFGTGADWEQEFLDEMEKGWRPFFERLRLLLTHFPGQRVTLLEAQVTAQGDPGAAMSAMRTELGIDQVGQTATVRGLTGVVEDLADDHVLLRLGEPVPGFLALYTYTMSEGTCTAAVQGQLFSDDAAELVRREQPAWQSWLEELTIRSFLGRAEAARVRR
jgi:uncharacterized protein YndB with AHSA1/START domain